MLLDCALEVSFLGVYGGMVVSVMLGSGFVSFFFRSRRVYFPQDYMCRVLKNFNDCSICSVSKRLRRYFNTMKLCTESAKGCMSKCQNVGRFIAIQARMGVRLLGRAVLRPDSCGGHQLRFCGNGFDL